MNRLAGLFQACTIILRHCFHSIHSPDAVTVGSFDLCKDGKEHMEEKNDEKNQRTNNDVYTNEWRSVVTWGRGNPFGDSWNISGINSAPKDNPLLEKAVLYIIVLYI